MKPVTVDGGDWIDFYHDRNRIWRTAHTSGYTRLSNIVFKNLKRAAKRKKTDRDGRAFRKGWGAYIFYCANPTRCIGVCECVRRRSVIDSDTSNRSLHFYCVRAKPINTRTHARMHLRAYTYTPLPPLRPHGAHGAYNPTARRLSPSSSSSCNATANKLCRHYRENDRIRFF